MVAVTEVPVLKIRMSVLAGTALGAKVTVDFQLSGLFQSVSTVPVQLYVVCPSAGSGKNPVITSSRPNRIGDKLFRSSALLVSVRCIINP